MIGKNERRENESKISGRNDIIKECNAAFSSEGDFVEIRVLVLNFAKPSVPAPP